MNACKMRSEKQGEIAISRKISWIAEELVEIRTLEQRLFEDLKTSHMQDSSVLMARVLELDSRADKLDWALD